MRLPTRPPCGVARRSSCTPCAIMTRPGSTNNATESAPALFRSAQRTSACEIEKGTHSSKHIAISGCDDLPYYRDHAEALFERRVWEKTSSPYLEVVSRNRLRIGRHDEVDRCNFGCGFPIAA